MNGTPRVRSGGFPQTPGTFAPRSRPQQRQLSPSPASHKPRSSLPPAPENVGSTGPSGSQPVIPTHILEAPKQRAFAAAAYGILFMWRFFDWIDILEENGGSWYYFAKWAFLDFVFIFSLPSLRIPWLELSSPSAATIFFLHMVFNWLLMFNIPVPWHGWLVAFVKVFYDRELSISEHTVRPSSILYNSSLIMGKQIINILPEGSAVLNPEKRPYCLGPQQSMVTIPIYFNSTIPAQVELIRFDLDTNDEERIKLTNKQLREISKVAGKIGEDGERGFYQWGMPIKKPGAYQLGPVLDEYKLEIQRISAPTYIVPCPLARVKAAESATRCLGDLSDLSLQVNGSPPLKIHYSRTINGKDHSFHYQSIQPDGFSNPMAGSQRASAIIQPGSEDFTWARAQSVDIGLNESMTTAGSWQYSIDAVTDGFGNIVNYTQALEDTDAKPKSKSLLQDFTVRQRPHATLKGCDTRNPLKVAKGQSSKLPIVIVRPDKQIQGVAHTVTWSFSPIDTLTKNGDHGEVIEAGSFVAKSPTDQPVISAPGLYTLKSVSCDSCDGEIEEPSSCLLLNPLEPKMTISSEEIPDKCAGKSIGLRVNLDMIGTPPFKVMYQVTSQHEGTRHETVDIQGLRQQIELLPRRAGSYKYRFVQLGDSIYKNLPLAPSDEYRLEQDVKPPATAFFDRAPKNAHLCLDQPVKVDVRLQGDGPFTLEWELVHDGKRKSEKISDLTTDVYTIETAPLSSGGDYTLALKSVQDKTGCRVFLKEEIRVSVTMQRPRAAFGVLDNKKSVTIVEDATVGLPLRLSGTGPWKVKYRNIETGEEQVRTAKSGNDVIDAKSKGTYEIIEVSDSQCPGIVDARASKFEVGWFSRPELSLATVDGISATTKDHVFQKEDICEGDIDGFDIALQGSPPYHVQYEIKHKPKSGSGAVARKDFDAALGKASISMDTSKAGQYTYTFSALSDNLYNSDRKHPNPLTVVQNVNAKPSASFVKPGQTTKLCMSESANEERIPIRLEGVAPFYLEVEIKHHAGSFPEIFRIPNIPSNKYELSIPRQYLKLGAQQLRIRKVRDGRGCQTTTDIGGPAVHIQLFDAPAIYPLEQRADYCVGERIAYTLSGSPPFEIQYEFNGQKKKAKSTTTNFRRIAEHPGEFIINSVSDRASDCPATVNLAKSIHPMPSVRISKGRVIQVDIHEGSEVEILFEFWGTPPFEFTYTRSSNARKNQKSQVLETRHDVSHEHSKVVTASLEGTYEVVAIKDKYCAFSTMNVESKDQAQKLLQF